jgi:DNA-binding NtrC family response regulator
MLKGVRAMARILLVEEKHYLRAWFANELESDGHEILETAKVDQALEVLDAFSCYVDFVVMDITERPIDKAHDIMPIQLRHGGVPLILNIGYDKGQAHFVPLTRRTHITRSVDLSELKKKIREIEAKSRVEDPRAVAVC